ncbi:hypothetical protein HNP33_002536 [Comamonas odontotermitis]|uniref:Uncharacterized protein n=1 Tax=Comamonas odontotermitis TaxID=379895 RepID=A0ABR6RHE8_9BURK|nr:hypothetical protein [Comamonas odontotermitis]MBB6578454.1 hypothetical protein [Comamonas odontotermitis]
MRNPIRIQKFAHWVARKLFIVGGVVPMAALEKLRTHSTPIVAADTALEQHFANWSTKRAFVVTE